jgi:hypothetical protein
VESYGGVVHILPYVENRSTTYMIQRIRDVYAGPDGEAALRAPALPSEAKAHAAAPVKMPARAGQKNGKRS